MLKSKKLKSKQASRYNPFRRIQKKCGRIAYYQRKGIAKRLSEDNETIARTLCC